MQTPESHAFPDKLSIEGTSVAALVDSKFHSVKTSQNITKLKLKLNGLTHHKIVQSRSNYVFEHIGKTVD